MEKDMTGKESIQMEQKKTDVFRGNYDQRKKAVEELLHLDVNFDILHKELVIGNKEFLLCGAGAAGPALEGGVVRTGMRADVGAVDEVKIRDGNIFVHVIGKQAECFEVMHGERKKQKKAISIALH